MDQSDVDLAARVSGLIRKSGLERRSIAAEVGMDPTALSKALAGKRRFRTGELEALARLLEVSLDELIGGDPPPLRALSLAVQQLWVSAQQPAAADVALAIQHEENVAVSPSVVEQVIGGTKLYGWRPVELVVTALGGDPAAFRPLWLAARRAAPDTGPGPDTPSPALVITDVLAGRLVRRVEAELMRPHGDRGAGLVQFDSGSEGAGERDAHWLATVAVKAVILELLFGGSGRDGGAQVPHEVGGGDLV